MYIGCDVNIFLTAGNGQTLRNEACLLFVFPQLSSVLKIFLLRREKEAEGNF